MVVKKSEYTRLFLSEAREILNSSNNVLVNLEKDPANLALLHELFRHSHTLKSMAQNMGHEEIARLTHSMEATLALLRSGEFKADKDTLDLLFKSIDTLGMLVEEVYRGKTEGVDVSILIQRFEEISCGAHQEDGKHIKKKRAGSIRDHIDHHQTEEKAQETPSHIPLSEAQTIRVPLDQLDNLMDIAGELAITRMRLSQIAKTKGGNGLEETVDNLSRLTSQLQDQMMQLRLVPLEYIFYPYQRMVRDIAADQKKKVDLLIEGSDIGLDRSIQDEINESLLHLLKNAVAHGIEEPEDRVRLKKPKRGKIRLIARRERSYVVIELSDDGRGIDIEEVKEVALKKGIVTMEELSALAPEELVMLTTYPGYSRVKQVTEAAGGGVGLNAAKFKVESFGGIFSIYSSLNEGTTISIKLPLSIAIAQAMLVGIADETYCIPLSYIAETIKVSPLEIKTIKQHEVLSHRDTVLPLTRLREKLGFPALVSQPTASDTPAITPTLLVVVVGEGPKKLGLVVDSIIGQQEVVMKPFAGVLKKTKFASGATILGTGRVALIVDVPSLL